jgi:hypothetical protein
MNTTGRTFEPGVEYECPNCKGNWNYVETPDFNVQSKKNGTIKGKSIFYPVMPPKVIADIIEQRPNKAQLKRIKKWAKDKQLKNGSEKNSWCFLLTHRCSCFPSLHSETCIWKTIMKLIIVGEWTKI